MLAHEKITVRNRLGFIGLGHLGSPIARRLVEAGFPRSCTTSTPQKLPSWQGSAPRLRTTPENSLVTQMWCCRVFPMNSQWKLSTWEQATSCGAPKPALALSS